MSGLSRGCNQGTERWFQNAAGLWLAIYLLLGFFTPLGFGAVSCLAFTGGVLLLTFLRLCNHEQRPFSLEVLLLLGFLALALVAIVLLSPYSFKTAASYSFFLADAVVLFMFLRAQKSIWAYRVFYVGACIGLTLTFALFVVNPDFFRTFAGITSESSIQGPLLYGAPDKNWTAVFVFLFFVLSVKRKCWYGVLLGCVYPLLYSGRQYILITILFFMFMGLLLLRRSARADAALRPLRAPTALLLFALSLPLVVSASGFWIDHAVSQGTAGYKESLNDDSNAMRVYANAYAFDEICSSPQFLLFGYDSDTAERLGIVMGSTDPYETLYIDGLYRLVTPHEEVLDTLLREGAVFSLAYYALLSLLISRLVRGRFNVALFGAYFLGSFLLSSMFKQEFLLLFLFVVAASGAWKRSRGKRRCGSRCRQETLDHMVVPGKGQLNDR